MQNQAYAFVIFILNGFLIGLLFDIFRIFRKTFKTPDFITYFEDFSFWIISGLILLYSIFKYNNGELRIYIFLGVILGTSIYLLIFSKFFITVSVNIINLIKKIFKLLIIKPVLFFIKIIKKVVINPIKKIFEWIKKSISKIMSIIKNKTKKIKIKKIKRQKKKEFENICRILL